MRATRYQRTLAKKDQIIANLKEQLVIRDKSSRPVLENKIKRLQAENKKLRAENKASSAIALPSAEEV